MTGALARKWLCEDRSLEHCTRKPRNAHRLPTNGQKLGRGTEEFAYRFLREHGLATP